MRYEQLVAHIQLLWNAKECEIRLCEACKLAFAWPFVAGDGHFYNLAYPHVDYPKARWEWVRTAEVLKGMTTRGRKSLEIGSGFGYFLDLVCPSLFDYTNMVSIEYNAVAAQRLAEKGCSVFSEDIREPYFTRLANTFDFVFMFQVLEHMDRLQELFERLNLVTRNGANLFIAVPNSDRTDFNEANHSLIDMPPNHISRWSSQAFGALAQSAGWKVVKIDKEPMSFPAFIKQDLIYSHMRRSQIPGSLSNRVRSRPRSNLRRLEEALVTLLYSPLRLGVWARALGRDDLGNSMLVHLQRG